MQTNGTEFEADFGDLAGGPYVTDDPGFDADESLGAFTPGNWLQLQGLGTLQFWNGTSWSSSVLNGEEVRIDDAVGNTTIFSSSSVTNPFAIIGEIDANGDMHEHIDYSIFDISGSLGGSVGAYWITFALIETVPNSTTPASTASAPINLFFNLGLAEVDFDAAVDAAVVPVPAAVYFFISGLSGLGIFKFRRANG